MAIVVCYNEIPYILISPSNLLTLCLPPPPSEPGTS